MAQLKPTVSLPKISIPTGYESQQRSIEMKRKIANALMSQGLQTQPNMGSWAQVAAQLAQAYFGKQAEKKATEMEVDLKNRVAQDYATARTGLLNDVKSGMQASDIVAAHGNNPLLSEDVKPYTEALAAALRNREGLINYGGKAGVRVGDVMGQYENDPNKMVHVNPATNEMYLNPVAVTASGLGQGKLVPEQGTYATKAPLLGGPAMKPPVAGAAAAEPIDAQGLSHLRGTLSPDVLNRYLQQGQIKIRVNTPEEALQLQLPPGAIVVRPDGTEIEVM